MSGHADARDAASPASAGLNRLDRERAASLADEGGASGAVVESQESALESQDEAPRTGRPRGKAWLAAFGVGFLAAWRLSRRSRRR
jgi:hypothetical protein